MTSPRPGAPVCVSVDASQNGVLGVRCELPDAVRAAQARRRGEQLQHELHLQLDLLKLDLVRKETKAPVYFGWGSFSDMKDDHLSRQALDAHFHT